MTSPVFVPLTKPATHLGAFRQPVPASLFSGVDEPPPSATLVVAAPRMPRPVPPIVLQTVPSDEPRPPVATVVAAYPRPVPARPIVTWSRTDPETLPVSLVLARSTVRAPGVVLTVRLTETISAGPVPVATVVAAPRTVTPVRVVVLAGRADPAVPVWGEEHAIVSATPLAATVTTGGQAATVTGPGSAGTSSTSRTYTATGSPANRTGSANPVSTSHSEG